jgi:class 3 adenylate cyclase
MLSTHADAGSAAGANEVSRTRLALMRQLNRYSPFIILGRVEAIRVDFHNQRLHAVVAKPYDSESERIHRAVATGQLIVDVLARTGEDADHPAARVRIGIDSVNALAVNNGRRGHREPLFLSEPANHAAKRATGGKTPGTPFSTLDIEELSVKNSRRQDAVTVYGDLDGFTAYVSRSIGDNDSARHVVRTLHVLRSELDAALHTDFAGRKVRFIGDCIHGLVVEGTAQTTNEEATISNMTLCAGAIRSSFNLAIGKLEKEGTDASSLGLQIGFEYGPMTVTRLGMKGDLVKI